MVAWANFNYWVGLDRITKQEIFSQFFKDKINICYECILCNNLLVFIMVWPCFGASNSSFTPTLSNKRPFFFTSFSLLLIMTAVKERTLNIRLIFLGFPTRCLWITSSSCKNTLQKVQAWKNFGQYGCLPHIN